jgi:hypothetical protein
MDSSSFFRDILYNLYMYVYNNSEFFNERIITAIIQEEENCNTSRRRVVESSE